jgi:sugar phosphate permease
MHMEMNRWQKVTMVSLLCGYGGFYFCRSNLGAAGTLLIEDPNLGITITTMGWFQTLGIATYLFGKFTMGLDHSMNGVEFVGGETDRARVLCIQLQTVGQLR